MGPALCRIRERKKLWVLHHDQLKPYSGLEVPMWATRFGATLKLGGDRAPERAENEPGDGQSAPQQGEAWSRGG